MQEFSGLLDARAQQLDYAAFLTLLLADEVQHVRFANRRLKQMAAENPRVLLQVAAGVQLLRKVTAPTLLRSTAQGLTIAFARLTAALEWAQVHAHDLNATEREFLDGALMALEGWFRDALLGRQAQG